MTLEQIQLFRDIAATRSLSRAARLNGKSQSGASQLLSELERRFETRLADRKRPLHLTQAGKLLHEFCREVTLLRQDFDAKLEGLKGVVEGVCRVASIYSIGLSEMSGLEAEFSRRYPSAELKVEYLRPEKVYEAVRTESADVGLVSYPESSKEILATPWREETMMVATSPRHPLAGNGPVQVSQLRGEAFIAFDEDLPIAREIRRFLREAGVEVNQVGHFDNVPSMKEAVALGSGISILPEPVLRTDVQEGRLCALPLESPGLRRPIGVVQLRRRKPNRATQSFLHLLRDQGR